MGFATWNAFHRHFTEQNFYDAADLMASNGMQAAGYEYINVVGLPGAPVSITLLPGRKMSPVLTQRESGKSIYTRRLK